jgi:hypothetical protein
MTSMPPAPTTIHFAALNGRVDAQPGDVALMKAEGLGSSTGRLFHGSFDPASGVVRFDNHGVVSFWLEWTVTPEILRDMAATMERENRE